MKSKLIELTDGSKLEVKVKTGKAVFSDGTYLEYVNGFLVGGNTKEGGF